jgi:IS605 OrfB family transposase
MSEKPIFTYQTRLVLDNQESALGAYASLYGKVERSLFAALATGGDASKLKSGFLKKFGITARQYNAVAISLKGKIASIRERRTGLIKEADVRISKARKVIVKLETKCPGTNKLHQKKRRLATMEARLAGMRQDHDTGAVRLCFGSKRLFRAQFDLEANGYASMDEWRADWKDSRASSFFVIGSKDETSGCQGCMSKVAEDGSLTLRLRMPDGITEHGKHVELLGVDFAYGQDKLLEALDAGTAISYRFVRDEKSWRLFVSAESAVPERVTHRQVGAIGVDVNADHLAVSEIDRFGNVVDVLRVSCTIYGKTTDQAKALIGDAAKIIAEKAMVAGKPVVVEKLDFAKKKAEAETANPGYARMLSAFACSKTSSAIHSACFRRGVEVIEINPAYTSVIGAVNFAQQFGISVHLGAATAIARRGLGFSERSAVRMGIVPVGNGGHSTFSLPARNRKKHIWSFWSNVRTKLKAAHVAHFRSGNAKANPAPLALILPLCSTWNLSAGIRHANRFQNCLGNVLDEDIPW